MRILGIDYGSKRMGLAVSDPTRMIARSLVVITRTDLKRDLDRLVEVIEQQEASDIVIGMPVSKNGSLGEKAKEVIDFIDKMKKRIKIPIIQWDERFTTVISERLLIEADMSRARRKQVIDKVAASVMLQSYLDSNE